MEALKENIPAPPSPLEHIMQLSEKGAIFYLEGNVISSEQAIQVVKSNKHISIQSHENNRGKPEVHISFDKDDD